MKISRDEFLSEPDKMAVTFLGMSGAGKTYLSCRLSEWGWRSYSCDYEIGSRYLKDKLDAFAASGRDFSAEDISLVSEYLGKLGNEQLGGYGLGLFLERQQDYNDAEIASLREVGDVIDGSGAFVLDSTGSLCEIEDEAVLRDVGERTLFVYLKSDEEAEKLILQRAREYPKPLFFPKEFLLARIDEYLAEKGLGDAGQMEPDDFSRWVFPRLFEARKPKYQRLADLYGVTIPAGEFAGVSSADEFVQIVASYL